MNKTMESLAVKLLDPEHLFLSAEAYVSNTARTNEETGGQKAKCEAAKGDEAGDEEGGRLSTNEVTFGWLNVIFSNPALLTLPYRFKECGVFQGMALVMCFLLNGYTAWQTGALLEDAKQRGVSKPDFRSIGSDAFGSWSGNAIALISGIDAFLFLVMILLVNGVNVMACFPGRTAFDGIALSVVTLAVVEQLSGKVFAYFEAMGIGVSLVVVLFILTTSAMLPEWGETPSVAPSPSPAVLQTSWSFGLFTTGYHILYPNLFNQSMSRENYNRSLVTSHVAMLSIWLFLGVATVWTFGDAIQPNILANIGRDVNLQPIPGLEWMTMTVAALVVLKNLSCMKICVRTLGDSFVGLLEGVVDDESRNAPRLLLAATKIILTLLAAILALECAQGLLRMEDLIAESVYAFVSLVFPPASYMALKSSSLVGKLVSLAIVASGLLMVGLGLLSFGDSVLHGGAKSR